MSADAVLGAAPASVPYVMAAAEGLALGLAVGSAGGLVVGLTAE